MMNNKIYRSYLNHLKYVEQLSEATVNSYISDLDILIETVDEDIVRLNPTVLQDLFYKWSKEVSASSLSRRLSSIRHFYKYCVETKEIDHDPTQHITISKQKKSLPDYLTLNEVEQLLSFETLEFDDYLDKAIIEVLFSSGLRVSELINIDYSRYYKKEKFLKIIGKGNKERIVPITDRAIEAIESYEKNNVYRKSQSRLFLNSKSLPLTRQSVYNRLKKRQIQTGLRKEITPHMLRHSFASAMINNDADLRVVQELLGHEVISTTQIYTHLENRSKKRMVEQFHPGKNLKKGK